MHTTNFERLVAARPGNAPWRSLRWKREWCFCRFAARQALPRLGILLALLLAGGWLFQWLEPENILTLPHAMFYTWSLVFGQPPEEFPSSRILQTMFFVVPVLGITVILEGIIDLSLLVRDRRRNERKWCSMMAASMKNHIVIVGFGKLGFRTFRLLRSLGEPVVVIERSEECQFLEEVRRDGSPILIGDARRESLLTDANVAAARSIVLCSNDDLANLEIALDARKLNSAILVVLRMFDQNMADKIRDGFNIHIAMSQSAISAPVFASAAIDPSIVGSFVVGDQLVVMQRWRVDAGSPLTGRAVGELTALHGVSVVERQSADGRKQLFPPADATFSAGDVLLIQGPFEAVRRVRGQVNVMAP